jgi:putative FmdB family regulatory protein
MPLYEYRCENGHTFEVMQRMADEPVQTCQICGAPVQRVFHPVAVHFKGSGFYNTDYGKQRRGGAGASEGDSKSDSSSGGDSKSSDSSSGGDSKSSDSSSTTKTKTESSSGSSNSSNSSSSD